MDVAIVGAGILGAAAAWHLACAGVPATLVEADAPAAGATGNSFAWVNAVRKEPEAYHRLNADGVAEYRTLAEELGGVSGYRGGGSLEWADPASGDERDELRARVERLTGRGYPARFVTAAFAASLEPHLRIPADADVAFYAADGWLDAPRLVATLVERATALGARLVRARVHGARREGRRVAALVTDAGELPLARVLFTAGAATQPLLAALGVRVPVRRVPGVLAVTSPPAAPLQRVVHAPGIHLRPDATGGVLLGATDIDAVVTETAVPSLALVKPLLDRGRGVLPSLQNAELVAMRVGVRPMPADGHTVAGALPGLDNAWVIVTHSAITMGPMLARLIANELLGERPAKALAPFRPSRFA